MNLLFCSECLVLKPSGGDGYGLVLGEPNGSLVSLLLPPVEPSLGAVSDVTAGGVIGSGTHNTGIKHGILATQVSPPAWLLP